MIRANLLPRRRRILRAFGFDLSVDFVRYAASIAFAIVATGGVTGGVDFFRLQRIDRAALDAERLVRAGSSVRADERRLGIDVARLDALDRIARAFRASGNHRAVTIARIGNAVPARVWLDGIGPADGEVRLNGGASDLRALAIALGALGAPLAGGRTAALVSLSTDDARPLHFVVRVGGTAR